MGKIEDLLYDVYQHGKRDEMFKKVNEIRRLNTTMPLEEVYDKAYYIIMKK